MPFTKFCRPGLAAPLLVLALHTAAFAQPAAPRLMVQSGPQPAVQYVFSISPDNRLIASAGDDRGHVTVWESASGRRLCQISTTLGASPAPAFMGLARVQMAFAPDGHSLAVASGEENIGVWDLRRCALQHEVALEPRSGKPPRSIAALADGRLLILGGDGRYATARVFAGQGQLSPVNTSGPTDSALLHRASADGQLVLESGTLSDQAMADMARKQAGGVLDALPGGQQMLDKMAASGQLGDILGRISGTGPSAGPGAPGSFAMPHGVRVRELRAGAAEPFELPAPGTGAIGASGSLGSTTALSPSGRLVLTLREGQLALFDRTRRSKQAETALPDLGLGGSGPAAMGGGVADQGVWVGFSADEKRVFVWRGHAFGGSSVRANAATRGARLEVRQASDLKLIRSVDYSPTLSDNFYDTLAAGSFTQSADRRLLVLGVSTLTGGKMGVVDLTTDEPKLRTWTPSFGFASHLAWADDHTLVTLHTRQLTGTGSALVGREAGQRLANAGSEKEALQIQRYLRWDLRGGALGSGVAAAEGGAARAALGSGGAFAAFWSLAPPELQGDAQVWVEVHDTANTRRLHRVALAGREGERPLLLAVSPDGQHIAATWPPGRQRSTAAARPPGIDLNRAMNDAFANATGDRASREQRREQRRNERAAARPQSLVTVHDAATGALVLNQPLPLKLNTLGAGGLRFVGQGADQALAVFDGDREAALLRLSGGAAPQLLRSDSGLFDLLLAEGGEARPIVRQPDRAPGAIGLPVAAGQALATPLRSGVLPGAGSTAFSHDVGLIGQRLVAVNPAGTQLATAAGQTPGIEIYSLDASGATRTRTLAGHASAVVALAFSPNGRLLASSSEDGEMLLWNLATGRWVAKLHAFSDGTWAVVDPEGRFDTNQLENIEQLHWVMGDEPFTALPLDIFMRDYYEPRLLARLMAGETLRPIRPLAELNRARPELTISAIEPADASGNSVNVTVRVRATRDARGRDSGAQDLRLFRNGQLVGYAPQADGAIALDAAKQEATLTFRNIRLPAGRAEVEFSTYAFNQERVKSATVRSVHVRSGTLAAPKRRAFIVAVGVNAYDSPAWRLRYAANDARLMLSTLAGRMRAAGGYSEIVEVPLIADGPQALHASKAHLRAAIDILAGRPGDRSLLAGVPQAKALAAAGPDDVVIISFSGHGVAGERGEFYLLPQDLGAGNDKGVTDALLARSVSSTELSAWLRDLDAGDTALVIDACHSAAAVEQEGFKPGPMGSRGLGQLAYDKGIRILAASQADDVALESGRLQHGLLSFSLLRDGLEAQRADHLPTDQRIELAEWLGYGAQRVPVLYEALRSGAPITDTRGAVRLQVPAAAQPIAQRKPLQQPALFDFTRRPRSPVIATVGR